MKTIGILGTGFGEEHLRIYRGLAGVSVRKVFGRNEEKLRTIRDKYGVEVTTNIDAVLDDPEIDRVDICLPTALHREYIGKALDAGKTVFCETPVCGSAEELVELDRLPEDEKRRVGVSMFIKFFPEYVYLKKLAESGDLGGLRSLGIHRRTAPIWGDLGVERIVENLMIHDIDFVSWLLGSPESVHSDAVGREGRSHVAAVLRYPSAVVRLEGSSMLPSGYPFTVGYDAIFDDGFVEFSGRFSDTGIEKKTIMYSVNGREDVVHVDRYPYEAMLEHSVADGTGGASLLSLDSAIASMKLALRIRDCLKA